jgi:hypothetical protein
MAEADLRSTRRTLSGRDASDSSTLQLNTKLSNRSWLGDNDDEVDPFAEVRTLPDRSTWVR